MCEVAGSSPSPEKILPYAMQLKYLFLKRSSLYGCSGTSEYVRYRLAISGLKSVLRNKQTNKVKHRVTIPCKWSFEKWRFSYEKHLKSLKTWNPADSHESSQESCKFAWKVPLFIWKVPHFIWKAPHFIWKAPHFISKAPHFIWKVPHFTLSFWVMIKYRSFFRKTNKCLFHG